MAVVDVPTTTLMAPAEPLPSPDCSSTLPPYCATVTVDVEPATRETLPPLPELVLPAMSAILPADECKHVPISSTPITNV